jgi:hypothetical protein
VAPIMDLLHALLDVRVDKIFFLFQTIGHCTRKMSQIFKKLKTMVKSKTGNEKGKNGKNEKSDKKERVRSWKPNVSYKSGDLVKYRGRKYICRVAHRSARDVTPLTAAQNWDTSPVPPMPEPPIPPVTPVDPVAPVSPEDLADGFPPVVPGA